MSDWQPIETAPKDVPILCFVKDYLGEDIIIACKLFHHVNEQKKLIFTTLDPIGLGGYDWEWHIDYKNITKWMPMPEFPK